MILCLSAPFAFFQLQGGCSGQSEGQLCDPNNLSEGVNQDCADGLECRSTSAGASSTAGVCCLPNSTHPSCVNAGTTSGTTSSSSSSSSTSTSSSGTTTTTSGTGGMGGTGGTGGMGTGGMGSGTTTTSGTGGSGGG